MKDKLKKEIEEMINKSIAAAFESLWKQVANTQDRLKGLERDYDYIDSEAFIDKTVHRIMKKQLK